MSLKYEPSSIPNLQPSTLNPPPAAGALRRGASSDGMSLARSILLLHLSPSLCSLTLVCAHSLSHSLTHSPSHSLTGALRRGASSDGMLRRGGSAASDGISATLKTPRSGGATPRAGLSPFPHPCCVCLGEHMVLVYAGKAHSHVFVSYTFMHIWCSCVLGRAPQRACQDFQS